MSLVLVAAACGGIADEPSTTEGTTVTVAGYVHAGPVCPVAQNPPDPACADRPVEGAVILVYDAVGGVVLAEARSDQDGVFAVELPPGDFLLVPQPVVGLLGTAAPLPLTVATAPISGIDFAYDTGIR